MARRNRKLLLRIEALIRSRSIGFAHQHSDLGTQQRLAVLVIQRCSPMIVGLIPASATVPAATQHKKYHDYYEKCGEIHVHLLGSTLTISFAPTGVAHLGTLDFQRRKSGVSSSQWPPWGKCVDRHDLKVVIARRKIPSPSPSTSANPNLWIQTKIGPPVGDDVAAQLWLRVQPRRRKVAQQLDIIN